MIAKSSEKNNEEDKFYSDLIKEHKKAIKLIQEQSGKKASKSGHGPVHYAHQFAEYDNKKIDLRLTISIYGDNSRIPYELSLKNGKEITIYRGEVNIANTKDVVNGRVYKPSTVDIVRTRLLRPDKVDEYSLPEKFAKPLNLNGD